MHFLELKVCYKNLSNSKLFKQTLLGENW